MDGALVGAESLWPSVIQVHPQQVQASSGWMVRRWVLNHSSPVWFRFIHNKFRHPVDGWCARGCWIILAQCDSGSSTTSSGIQWMDGAPVGVESLWPSVIQVHPQQVQASSGWMVCRWVLNHSGPVWFDGNQCSGIQWMDGAPAGAESLWPSVIRWKPVFSSRFHILVHLFFENRENEW